MDRFHLSQREKILAICLLLAIVCLGYLFFQNQGTSESAGQRGFTWNDMKPSQHEKPSTTTKAQELSASFPGEGRKQPASTQVMYVDVKGAVESPGVYKVTKNQVRVIDVIKKAGGFAKKANRRGINLAKQVVDEMVIYVPKQGEKGIRSLTRANTSTVSDKISINRASQKELERLPGIGDVKAGHIIQYRKTNGPFQSLEELKKVTGIGDKTFAGLKGKIRL